MAGVTIRQGHQTSVSGELWPRPMNKEMFPVDILVETRADRGSYMSLAFDHMIDKLGRLVTSIRKGRKVTLNASNPPSNNPPLHANISLHLPAYEVSVRNWVRKITFRVVDGPPYGLIVGADYLKK